MQEIELISYKCVCREADWLARQYTMRASKERLLCLHRASSIHWKKKTLLSVDFFQLDSIVVSLLFIIFVVTEITWLMCMVGHSVEEDIFDTAVALTDSKTIYVIFLYCS